MYDELVVQPKSMTFDQLKKQLYGMTWKTLRTSHRGNTIVSGSNYDYTVSGAPYGEFNAWVTNIWAVISPDNQVLEYIDSSEEYSW